MISWYDMNGDVVETISVMSDDTIIYNSYFWTAMNGSIDMELSNEKVFVSGAEEHPPSIIMHTHSNAKPAVIDFFIKNYSLLCLSI